MPSYNVKADHFHEQNSIVLDANMHALRRGYWQFILTNSKLLFHQKDAELYCDFVDSHFNKYIQDSLLANGAIKFLTKELEKRTELVEVSLYKRYNETFNEDMPIVPFPRIDSLISILSIPESKQLDFALLLSLKKIDTSLRMFCKKMHELPIHLIYIIDPNSDYGFLKWYRQNFVYYLDSFYVNNTYIPVTTNPIMVSSKLLEGEITRVRIIEKSEKRVDIQAIFQSGIGIIIE